MTTIVVLAFIAGALFALWLGLCSAAAPKTLDERRIDDDAQMEWLSRHG